MCCCCLCALCSIQCNPIQKAAKSERKQRHEAKWWKVHQMLFMVKLGNSKWISENRILSVFFCWTLRFLSFAVRNLILPMQNWYNWNRVFHLLFVLSKRCLLINAFIIVDYIKFQTNKNTPTKITEKNNEKIHFNFLIHQMNNMGDETCWKAFHFFFRFCLLYCCWFFFLGRFINFSSIHFYMIRFIVSFLIFASFNYSLLHTNPFIILNSTKLSGLSHSQYNVKTSKNYPTNWIKFSSILFLV